MGDIVHAMTALQFVKRHLPDCRIDWVVEQGFTEVLEHNPDIHTILPVNLKAIKQNRFQLFSEIKRVREYALNRYDLVIDMQGLIKSAAVSRMLGPSVGFDKDSIREKAASLFYGQGFPVPYEENVIERNLDLIAMALNLDFDKDLIGKKESLLFFTEKDRDKTAPFLKKGQKNVVYILGSSWKSKIYPKEKFLEIINTLEANHLLVWGSDSEYTYAQYIAEHSNATIVPRINLNELKALVSSADLVIGGDSGPTHFGWAMNRPSITIFGPTPSGRNTMETEINKVVDCGKSIDPAKLDKTDFCIREIDPKKIVNLAKGLLQ
jgi:heptosyltransferase-1